MANSKGRESAVRVFVAAAGGINCQLMTGALRRSRFHLTVVGYSNTLAGIQDGLRDRAADVAIIDSHLKDGATAGFDATRATRTAYPNVKVILMLASTERSLAVEAFRAGASGIFSQDDSFDLLCKSVIAVHRGQVWANSVQLQAVIRALADIPQSQAANTKNLNRLTKREHGLVQLVAEGMTNRDISKELNLSENTVRNYLFRIFNKVGTSNRIELARYAWNHTTEADSPDEVVVE
jgi:two-component system, NarL family, nitrate/nitrite response regulator NarL